MTQTPDTKPGNYYVTAIRDDAGKTVIPLAGPFRDDHAKALSLVDRCNDLLSDMIPQAHWYAYGTARTSYDYDKPGILNEKVMT